MCTASCRLYIQRTHTAYCPGYIIRNVAARRGALSDDAAASAVRIVVEKLAVLEVVFEVVGVGVAAIAQIAQVEVFTKVRDRCCSLRRSMIVWSGV